MILLTAAFIHFLSLVGFTFGPLRTIGECGDIYDSSHLVPFSVALLRGGRESPWLTFGQQFNVHLIPAQFSGSF